MLSRASELLPAPVGVLDDDSTPDFRSELRMEEMLAGTIGAVEGPEAGADGGIGAETVSALTGGYAVAYVG